MLQNTDMKIIESTQINAFGGINFVLEELNQQGIGDLLNENLPSLPAQSTYSWKDNFYALLSIFFCGGSYIEDIHTHLRPHIGENPYCNFPSSDTILRRMKSLASKDTFCRTKRGTVDHHYCVNDRLALLNIKLLKSLGTFNQRELTLDYDNTILFNEKDDSVLTYKKERGYQPGVCTINVNQILYLENRNGNSEAKSFQDVTLKRMFKHLSTCGINKPDNFRADSASYQYDVIQLLSKEVKHFYISVRKSYVSGYFSKIVNWEQTTDGNGDQIEIGELKYRPFKKYYKASQTPNEYRLVVKRKLRKDRQVDLITETEHNYTAIVTNDTEKSAIEAMRFYNKRGAMEKQFDVVKNDFGWNHMPFSSLADNTVFLYLTAMCKNIYQLIIKNFSKRFSGLEANFRIRRFIFKFIILPCKWIKRSRKLQLRVYGKIAYKT